MNIVLGSKNNSKERSIKLAMRKLGYEDIRVNSIDISSMVSSKPINEETLIGAKNRNHNLYCYCTKNNIPFDLLISIEGGYEQIADTYFIVSYASIFDSFGNEFIGKSSGIQITERMFNYVKDGKSLNTVIEGILNTTYNKRSNGITGYLTNGYYRRDIFEAEAIISAIQSMLNYESSYKDLESKIKM